jgi:iron complex transport system ATP-binding protein
MPDTPQSPLAIALDHVTLIRNRRTLLGDVTWHVPAGACCGVLGPNGAGKSTLLAVLTGHLWPGDGTVRVLGERYGAVELASFRKRMGFVGHSRLPEFHDDLSVFETVLAGRWSAILPPPHIQPTEADFEATRRELALVGMSARAEDPFGAMSSGEQMRVLLARALVADPELLILDEPTAPLDMAGRAAFTYAMERLIERRPGLTTILVTHEVADLPRHTTHITLVKEGRLVAHGPRAEALTGASLSDAFDCEIQLHQEDGHYWTRVKPHAQAFFVD